MHLHEMAQFQVPCLYLICDVTSTMSCGQPSAPTSCDCRARPHARTLRYTETGHKEILKDVPHTAKGQGNRNTIVLNDIIECSTLYPACPELIIDLADEKVEAFGPIELVYIM